MATNNYMPAAPTAPAAPVVPYPTATSASTGRLRLPTIEGWFSTAGNRANEILGAGTFAKPAPEVPQKAPPSPGEEPLPQPGGGRLFYNPRTNSYQDAPLWEGQVAGVQYDMIPEGAVWTGIGTGGWVGAWQDPIAKQEAELRTAQEGATAEFVDNMTQLFSDTTESWLTGSQNLMNEYREGYEPTFRELNDILGRLPVWEDTDYSNVERLLSQLEAGPTEEEIGGMRGQTAQTLGFDTWDQMAQDIQGRRGATRAEMPGLTEEERSAYQRMERQATSQAERRAQDQLEAVMGNTGSMTQYLANADELNRGIQDQRLQYQMAELNQHMALQEAALERSDRQLAEMLNMGQITFQQALDRRQQAVMGTLDGYLQQAAQFADNYRAEVQGILAQADVVYKGAMTKLGVDQGLMDIMESEYNRRVKPVLDQIEFMFQQEAMRQGNEALDIEATSAAFSSFVSILDLVIPG